MTGAVYVAIMPRFGFVLYVRRVNCDSTRLLLGGLVDLSVVSKLGATTLGEDFCDGGGECRLAVVDMACDAWIWIVWWAKEFVSDIPMVPMFMWGLARE